jgi:acetyltransferase-like isoleucine patch superfamily enzyme
LRHDTDLQISPLAYVAVWVRFGRGVVVHPFAVVGRVPDRSAALARQPAQEEWLEIGENTVIGPHAVIYGGTKIGRDCLIGDYASVREQCVLGDRVVVGRYVSINYECEIADDVRFQDTTHLTGCAKVGKGCFFGVGVVTSNDRRVDLVDYHYPEPQPVIFGERVMIGSGANIVAGVHVGDGALIGAGALVTKTVAPGLTVLGPRARPVDELELDGYR